MIYYSAEARGYALMMALVLGARRSALLTAVEHGRARWWAALRRLRVRRGVHALHERLRARGTARMGPVGAPRGAARRARRHAVAVVGFLPWLSGFKVDLHSPTTDILSALQPFDLRYVRSSLVHWAIGFPYPAAGTGVRDLPGRAGARRARARAGPGARGPARRGAPRAPPGSPTAGLVLVIVLAVSVPARRGARERGRLEPLRHPQPGGLVAGVRALPRGAARRRRRRGSASPPPRWRSARSRSAASSCSIGDFQRPHYDAVVALHRPQRGAAATSWSTA